MASDKHSDKGPKKVDTNHYKELQMKQTQKAQEIIQSQANTMASAQNAPTATKMTSSEAGGPSSSAANQASKAKKSTGG